MIAASPNGYSGTGHRTLTADIWMNYELGAATSTEFMGVGIGEIPSSPPAINGAAYLWTGDGGSSSDHRVFKDAFYVAGADMAAGTRQGSDPYYSSLGGMAPPPAQGQVGLGVVGSPNFYTQGGSWYEVEIDVFDDGLTNTATISIDGLLIAVLDCDYTGDGSSGCTTDGNIQLMYADWFSSLGNPLFQYGIFDNVEVTPEPTSLALLAVGGLVLLRRRR
jgi:hypothetical protein